MRADRATAAVVLAVLWGGVLAVLWYCCGVATWWCDSMMFL